MAAFSPNWPTPPPDLAPSTTPSIISSYPTPKSGFFLQAYDSCNAIFSPTGRIAMEQHANEGSCTAETSRALCTIEKRAGKSGSVLQPATPNFSCQGGDLTKSNDAGGVSISNEKAVHKHTGAGTLSKANSSTNHRFFMGDDATGQAAAGERVPTKNAILHTRQRKLLNLHARLDEQQARERTAISTLQGQLANLHGQLAKLKPMAGQLAISIDKHVSSVQASKPEKSQQLIVQNPSETPSSSSLGVTSATSVAPKVFGEMPTPRSECENYCYGSPNKIQISCMQDGDTKLSCNYQAFTPPRNDLLLEKQTRFVNEAQSIGDMSDVYAEEAIDMSEKMPSYDVYADDDNSSCNVLDINLFTQQNGEGKPEIEHTAKYSSNPSEYEIPSQSQTSATTTDQMQFEILDSTPKYDVCEEDDSVCQNTTSDVQDFTIELQLQNDERACHCPVMKASDSLVKGSNQLAVDHSMSKLRLLWDPGASALLHSTKSKPPEELGYVARSVPKALNLCNQVDTSVQQPSDSRWNMLVIHEEEKEWDPGEQTILSSTLNIDIAGVLQTSILTTSGVFIIPYVLTATIQLRVSTCVPKQSCYCRASSSHENHEVQFLWNPCILNQLGMLLDKSTVPKLVYSGQTTLSLSNFTGQPVDRKQFSAQVSLLSLSQSWCTTPSVFFQVHCLPRVLDWPYLETVQQLACYSRMSSSTQEEKDATAMYQVLRIQLPMRTTTHIWYPGIEPSLFLYKELHVHIIQLVRCSAIHACYFYVYALLPTTESEAYGSMDIIFITFLPP